MQSLEAAVGRSAYPGRGIALGYSQDGKYGIAAYFIMGRSENSRNRLFVRVGDGIETRAHDPAKMVDPSLIIYAPLRVVGQTTVLTNGDQTDTIAGGLEEGRHWVDSLHMRSFEPDAPHYTPRISGIFQRGEGSCSYALSILKSRNGHPDACLRQFFYYDRPVAGQGHFLHTYAENLDPLPSFAGEPLCVSMEGDIDQLARALWRGLDEENKISALVRFIHLDSGAFEERILNKRLGD